METAVDPDRASQTENFPALKVLGGRIDVLSFDNALQLIERKIGNGQFIHVITVNPLMLLETERDPDLRKVFDEAGLVVADSVGVCLIAALKGFPRVQRIPGIDFLTALCRVAGRKDLPVYLLGARPGVVERVRERLSALLPGLNVCGTAHGYFNEDEEAGILREIREKRPAFLFVGLSVPFQEKWIHRNSSTFAGMCAMGVGGSFDILSGDLRRAPQWLRKIGLEWVFRWIQEPWRWKRIARLPVAFVRALFAPGEKSVRRL